MPDLTRTGLNNQKRGVSVAVSETAATTANTFFNLPANSMVTAVTVDVSTADTTATSTVDVLVGATVVANEIPVAAIATVEGTVANTIFPTGGAVTIAAGAVAGAGDGVLQLVVEYIELDKVTGEYTN